MSSLHGLPKIYGMILIIFGMIFFIPSVAYLIELIEDLKTDGKLATVIMLGFAIVSIIASTLMIGFGVNIVWYHDEKIDDKTLDEKAHNSKYKPSESEKH